MRAEGRRGEKEGGRGEGGSGCCGLDVETGRVGSGARELSVLAVLTPRGGGGSSISFARRDVRLVFVM